MWSACPSGTSTSGASETSTQLRNVTRNEFVTNDVLFAALGNLMDDNASIEIRRVDW